MTPLPNPNNEEHEEGWNRKPMKGRFLWQPQNLEQGSIHASVFQGSRYSDQCQISTDRQVRATTTLSRRLQPDRVCLELRRSTHHRRRTATLQSEALDQRIPSCILLRVASETQTEFLSGRV